MASLSITDIEIDKERLLARLRPKRDAAWWQRRREMEEALANAPRVVVGKITEEDRYGDAPP